jgi:choline kinase
MIERVIILAGGKQSRLQGVPDKNMIDVHGQPNLARTLQMLRELGRDVRSVRIVSESLEMRRLGESQHFSREQTFTFARPMPTKGQSIVATVCEATAWSAGFDRFVVLLGDVIWQQAELAAVMELPARTVAIHRTNPHTGKSWGECLACVCDLKSLVDVQGIAALRDLRRQGFFQEVDLGGWSDDIDTPEDMEHRYPVLLELAAKERAQQWIG